MINGCIIFDICENRMRYHSSHGTYGAHVCADLEDCKIHCHAGFRIPQNINDSKNSVIIMFANLH